MHQAISSKLSFSLMGLLWAVGMSGADTVARRGARPMDPQQVIRALKTAEQAAGVQPTGNFSSADARVTAYYRCYYTGKLELPESYDGLMLRRGSKNGCSLDPEKYDVFFYPIEAVASGHAP